MHKTLISLLLAAGLLLAVSVPSNSAPAHRASSTTQSLSCRSPSAIGVQEFLRISRWVAAAASATELRQELAIANWPADSVSYLTDEPLCATLDSLVIAWLAGPGTGKLVGIGGSLGEIMVARIGATAFHVRPTASPAQPVPQYPWFVVDTLAPSRVAYWGQSDGL
jgi:hypothetical protein